MSNKLSSFAIKSLYKFWFCQALGCISSFLQTISINFLFIKPNPITYISTKVVSLIELPNVH